MKRVLYPVITGGAIGLVWGYLCNRYLGWAGVALTIAAGLAGAFWALRSLRELGAMEQELRDRLRRGMKP
jgi:uncharacterized membrane protein YeaQ/YmgE (transglycosylase-associated protein family)